MAYVGGTVPLAVAPIPAAPVVGGYLPAGGLWEPYRLGSSYHHYGAVHYGPPNFYPLASYDAPYGYAVW
ncbi:unnamed protein product [Rotaria sp. Silwood2]|nr:unnamed protein product [Rotaria sp. Silwood2]CAF3097578.1 unnamed protein product [Rotaria sp. Silwood2]CAF3128741.1 unnamed protein product [Rotaria sp. Silwood2]CAF4037562.1 unnamed protein product [Rotaria sp. Silwood2]CAF4350309.1 unnamed protein product [Rotaria sp. Silwood2]